MSELISEAAKLVADEAAAQAENEALKMALRAATASEGELTELLGRAAGTLKAHGDEKIALLQSAWCEGGL